MCGLVARPGLRSADVPAELHGHRADLSHDHRDVVDFQADLAGLDDSLLDRGEVPARRLRPVPAVLAGGLFGGRARLRWGAAQLSCTVGL